MPQCLCVGDHGHEDACAVHMSGTQEHLSSCFFSFSRVVSGDKTQVDRLGGKCLYLFRYLTGSYEFVSRLGWSFE